MTYQQFLAKHDAAHPYFCQDSDDVAGLMAKRKTEAFHVFMLYLDAHHPRKKASTMPANRTHRTNIIAYLSGAVNRICR